jgi:periplasmic copper chaperone A
MTNMPFSRRSSLMLLASAPALLLAGCGKEPVLRVNQAVVKLSPVEKNPSAMYFTLYGGPADVELVSVSSRSAIRADLHESKVDPKSGMMSMEKIDRLKVPAGSKILFKQGGKHLMLSGINMPARRLERIDVEFVFSNGDRILVETPIEKIAADG